MNNVVKEGVALKKPRPALRLADPRPATNQAVWLLTTVSG